MKREQDSNFGRKDGWIIELNSKKIAELIDPIFEDMFWYSYEVKIIDSFYHKDLFTTEFWENDELKFLSVSLNEYCKNTPIINIIENDNHNKRVIVRGLYV
ncbi:MAG: hypothetical protein R2825_14495 [Saprospiraceae bacterium]